MLYRDVARVQLKDTATLARTFVFKPDAVARDTVFIQVNTIGEMKDYDRKIGIVQVPELVDSLVRDPATNEVVDTLRVERARRAVPGVHYVAMDDPEMVSLLVIKANTVSTMLPVILLRDASLKEGSYRLRLQIVASDDFLPGEVMFRSRAIQFSDRLERPNFWDVQNVERSQFGAWSVRKHQFMIDVTGENIDDEWYNTKIRQGAGSLVYFPGVLQHYRVVLKTALNVYNSDPANTKYGPVPMRETDDPNSPLITFP
jgi:hypothetical protein